MGLKYSLLLSGKYSKTWLIQNSRDQKKSFFWIMKDLCNSKLRKKIIFQFIAPITVMCGRLSHQQSQITVSRSTMINVIFNTSSGSVTCYTGKFYLKGF
jgi:hypothetical protein